MTIKDFEQDIPPEILERGNNYYSNNHVVSLNENEPGMWSAVVTGTEDYNVNIEIENDEVEYWDCDCPFEGEVCKHVAAVLYAITDNELPVIKTAKDKKAKKKKVNNIDTIYDKTSKEELQEFISSQLSRNRNLKNSFLSHFAEYIEGNSESKYKTLIKNIIHTAEDRYGFVDYHSAQQVTLNLMGLLNKAKMQLEKKNRVESLVIVKAVIEEVPLIARHMDDSDGGTRDILDYAFELLSLIIEKAPPELKDKLFLYCIDEYPKQKYHDNGFEEGFLIILPGLITTEEQENIFLKMIDKQIEVEKGKQFPEYGVSSLLKLKFDFLSSGNRKEEAWELIEANKQYSELMKILVDEKIKNKDFIKAVELCLEGIKIAEKKQHPGTSSEWKMKLLAIYDQTNNIVELRKIAENLFFEHFFEMVYYRKLKSTYSSEEWNEVSESIIEKVKNKNRTGSYGDANILAKLFIEENYIERLLKLIEINASHINFVDEYAKYLISNYPDKILTFYEEGVKDLAKNTGRNFYKEIAGYLKKMKKISGGEEKVNAIITYFRTIYKNRRAMMEILAKIK